MFAIQRTWTVNADDNFLGYVYAAEESNALARTIIKHGAPEKWSIAQYTIKKIKWSGEDDIS